MAEQSALDLGVDKETKPSKPPHDPIEEMVGALFDPMIVYPSGWEETIPEHLKKELPLRRLAHIMLCTKGEASWDEATDLEALLYMYPLTLAHPLDESWTQIYLYLGTKCVGVSFPQEIRVETLTDYQAGELRDLKRWIYRQRVKARKERARERKAEPRPEPAKYEQLKLV